jgi:nickel superoxide dismutase
MKRLTSLFVAFSLLLSAAAPTLYAHCEVPCGIYADQRRFEQMLEDNSTIAKAIEQIKELAGRGDAQSQNQLSRWVATKELHATNAQHIIAQYFMTQRLKPGNDAASTAAYVKKLTAAHAVMVSAMKCKQTVDDANAKAMEKAIFDFYRAYEGREPNFEH